jgi:zinc transport system substrate-binding protein
VETNRRTPGVVSAIVTVAALGIGSACSTKRQSQGDRPRVVTSFYPLRFVTERVAGDLLPVTDLTPPGTEPHDLELTSQQIASVADADLVVYLAGFSPAVDDAARLAKESGFDIAPLASLDLVGDDGADPHFWLDPRRLASVADAVAQRLGQTDPKNERTYSANAATLRADLEKLDGEFAAGLTSCRSTVIVASHDAFGYLARRYGFTQKSIVGSVPDAEPTPADLRAVASFIRENAVTTIYAETLVDPKLAKTIATETGAVSAVLDPLEGLSDERSDYLSVMRSNLAALRTGQGCA